MAQIIYQIVTGTPDFTVTIFPQVKPDQIHNSLGVYSFDNVPDGNYIITIADSVGCVVYLNTTVSDSCILEGTILCVTTTSTTTINECILDGTIDCDVHCYGLLYNWYAATDARGIAPTGWHVPTAAEALALRNYIDPINNDPVTNVAGGPMKVPGLVYWNNPNLGATNTTGFNAIGSGERNDITGLFIDSGNVFTLWNTRNDSIDFGGDGALQNTIINFYQAINSVAKKKQGKSIRPIKDSSVWSAGETVTDIDGNIYPTIKIGTQVWMSENLKTTHYNNGDIIPEVTDNIQWTLLTDGALCAFNNDWSNACITIPIYYTTTTTTTDPFATTTTTSSTTSEPTTTTTSTTEEVTTTTTTTIEPTTTTTSTTTIEPTTTTTTTTEEVTTTTTTTSA